MRYLAESRKADDHWYPHDIKARARTFSLHSNRSTNNKILWLIGVEEHLDWHHTYVFLRARICALLSSVMQQPSSRRSQICMGKDHWPKAGHAIARRCRHHPQRDSSHVDEGASMMGGTMHHATLLDSGNLEVIRPYTAERLGGSGGFRAVIISLSPSCASFSVSAPIMGGSLTRSDECLPLFSNYSFSMSTSQAKSMSRATPSASGTYHPPARLHSSCWSRHTTGRPNSLMYVAAWSWTPPGLPPPPLS